jgi:hypothetical protein
LPFIGLLCAIYAIWYRRQAAGERSKLNR